MQTTTETPGHDATAGRRTAVWVRVEDRAAAAAIRSGGLAVLLAMLGLLAFLVWSAYPLFEGGRVLGERARFDIGAEPPVWVSVDPAFGRLITLEHDGVFRVRAISDGRVLAEQPALSDGTAPAAVRSEAGEGWLTLTRDDGEFEIVRATLDWHPAERGPGTVDGMARGDEPAEYVQCDGTGCKRWTLVVERLGHFKPIDGASAVDSRGKTRLKRYIAAAGPDGIITGVLTGRRALGAGTVRYRVSLDEPVATGKNTPPAWVYASGTGVWAAAVWRDGTLAVKSRGPESPEPHITETGEPVTVAVVALGSETILLGDERGGVSSWIVRGGQPRLIRRRVLGDSPVTSIRPGDRDRTIMAGFKDGSAVMYNILSNKIIARLEPPGGDAFPVAVAAASPDSRAVCVIDGSGGVTLTDIEPGHVEVSMTTLFGKVQYEGYDEPAYVYQSTGSTQAEPKFSLVPLIFGTMKATVVAMILAVPLAVLAAIYSSEFLHRDVRRYVKPTIELMASLPSVVLGFIAAMVVAPFVRDQLPRLMAFALVVPLTVVLAAHAWRILRAGASTEWGRLGRFAMIAAAVLFGVVLSVPAGTMLESTLFGTGRGGSIIGWLDGGDGPATPGWFVVLLLPVIGVLLFLDAAVLGPMWRRVTLDAAGRWANAVELGRLAVNLALSLGITYGLASALDAAGFDPRDSIFGPFSQRNTLVVGLIMGVAVVPIIYTISEDAIRAVPDRLRSASLGVGATPWQTALRVVLPVAGSGIFSAVMIGLGRAVGETMIVLMATGNTPEMSLNIFSGFRTLAANIAVELPEAPAGGTHYRVLFLCGLVLFAMTLVINTTAEVVRQHFRKRNAAL